MINIRRQAEKKFSVDAQVEDRDRVMVERADGLGAVFNRRPDGWWVKHRQAGAETYAGPFVSAAVAAEKFMTEVKD